MKRLKVSSNSTKFSGLLVLHRKEYKAKTLVSKTARKRKQRKKLYDFLISKRLQEFLIYIEHGSAYTKLLLSAT